LISCFSSRYFVVQEEYSDALTVRATSESAVAAIGSAVDSIVTPIVFVTVIEEDIARKKDPLWPATAARPLCAWTRRATLFRLKKTAVKTQSLFFS
jgi:hypothetical protein